MEMENNQIKSEEIEKKVEEPKPQKDKPFLARMTKLENEVAKLERQIEVIIKSLRR